MATTRGGTILNALKTAGHPGRLFPDPSEPITVEPFESVIERVLAVADDHADAPAVVLGDSVWSYARLRTAALALAAELEDLDVQPQDAVAVSGRKCPGLIVAILAVLARGAILVPVDPLLPAAQRRRMVKLARPKVLIEAGGPGPEDDASVLEPGVRVFTIAGEPPVGDDAEQLARDYRLPPIDGDDPAYLLFTSGTTGAPKGIVGRQRGLSHFLAWERELTGIGPGDRTAQLTGLSFDVVLRDIFLPLSSGAAMHLPDAAPGATPAGGLLTFLARDRITLIHAVPTIAGYWLSDVPTGLELPELRWVLFAGEPLPGALVEAWRATFKTPRIGNLYGPTETTLAKCFWEVPETPDPGVQPVGRAIPGAQALVMDGDRLCGPEEAGEIVIRTPYRSLGYLDAEGDPRAPFQRNPFTDEPDDLIYRTGDRGRYRPDGLLDIQGRLDDQIKILGVRIEPAEVTAELAAHPDVRSCVVVARPDPTGRPGLIAYVVPVGESLDVGALRAFLLDRMIAAKVPALFVPLTELPRTANGKVDRAALPEPVWRGLTQPTPEAQSIPGDNPDGRAARPRATAIVAGRPGSSGKAGPAPSDELVQTVVGIFGELLGTDAVDPDDDFFRLGGHSLMAARLIQRVEAATGVRLSVRALFVHATPRRLASQIAATRESERGEADGAEIGPTPRPSNIVALGEPSGGSVFPLRISGSEPPIFVIPGVGSRILYLRHLSAHIGDEQPLYGLHSRFLEDGSEYTRIEDLAARYVRDLRAVSPAGPYRLLGFSYGGLVALEVAQQLRADGSDVELLGIIDTRLPGLVANGPWSIPRSIPRRLLNLAAILQPLSPTGRRAYLRTRLRVARENTRARIVQELSARLPRALARRLPEHPYGPEEMAWLGADRRASRQYVPKPYPGEIVYFWAAHSQRPPSVYDHRSGWAEIATGGLDVRAIPGSHLTVLLEPLVRSTADAIRDALRLVAARRRTEGGGARGDRALDRRAG